ncbi:unnamed protein product [Cylicocyclus nassatus]|uniref:Uncharacterized protein n=1 Tax=Cylicocyclus nassatus TaxID=53992 RepID=A0AA36GNK3_CYLNA|nr:unnamed protein product [Cylicocyclus nassatus]
MKLPFKVVLPPLRNVPPICKYDSSSAKFSEEMTRPLANNLLLCDCHRIDVFVGVSCKFFGGTLCMS